MQTVESSLTRPLSSAQENALHNELGRNKEFRDELKRWLEDELKYVLLQDDEYDLLVRIKHKIQELEKDIGL